MCDAGVILQLFSTVLEEHVRHYRVNSADIRTGIQNMKEVYKPDAGNLSSEILDVANYDDPAHRIAYLHKYAPLHTALVADMVKKAIYEHPQLFNDFIINFGCVKICSLGGGPGSDVIGVLAVISEIFGLLQVSATVIDCMSEWKQTFCALIKELRYGNYGILGESVTEQYFEWSYIGNNLLGKMTNQVNNAIQSANLVTMVKFVSAAACKDTSSMIKDVFREMKPGALFLYIDNAGGGFHQLIEEVAKEYCLKRMTLRNHEHFEDVTFKVKRFSFVACYETDISFHLWRKTLSKRVNNTLERKSLQERQVIMYVLPSSIHGQKYKYEQKAEIKSYNQINTPQLDQVNSLSSEDKCNNSSWSSKTVIQACDQNNAPKLDQVNSQSTLIEYNNPSGYSKTIVQKPLHQISRTNSTVIYEKNAVQSGIFHESLYASYDTTRTDGTFIRNSVPQRNSPSSSRRFSVMNYIRNAICRELASLMIEELKKYFEDIVVINTRPTENFLHYLLETF